MKKLTAIGIVLLLCSVTFAAYASSAIKIFVNGKEKQSDVLPQIINDRVMVPIRFIAEELGADVQWDEHTNSVYIKNEPKIISSLLEADAKLYPFQETDGSYKGFILEIKGERKYFDWENMVNPTYAPKMLYDDINNDGKNELIVILTIGTGTGVHIEKTHVIDPDNFMEFEVVDPLDIISQNVDSSIIHEDGNVTTTVIINGQVFNIILDENYISNNNWADKAFFRNIIKYSIEDSKLKAIVSAQVSPTVFVGDIIITYKLEDNKYVMDELNYIPYEFNKDEPA